MAFTKQEIYLRHKERYHNDAEYRERVLNQKRVYYLNKRENDPIYMAKRAAYGKANSKMLQRADKEYNQQRPFQYAFRRLRMRAKQRNLPFNLTAVYLEDLWTGNCAIFNTPLLRPYSTARQVPDKATVDRVIPELGYVEGNVQWVSNRANIIKSFGTFEDHLTIAKYINAHSTGYPEVVDNK